MATVLAGGFATTGVARLRRDVLQRVWHFGVRLPSRVFSVPRGAHGAIAHDMGNQSRPVARGKEKVESREFCSPEAIAFCSGPLSHHCQ